MSNISYTHNGPIDMELAMIRTVHSLAQVTAAGGGPARRGGGAGVRGGALLLPRRARAELAARGRPRLRGLQVPAASGDRMRTPFLPKLPSASSGED